MTRVSEANVITVQQELRPRFLEWNATLREWDVRWSFSEDVEAELAHRPTGVAILPALNEKQVERAGQVVEDFPLARIIGVVHEAEGFHTRQVIQAGAVFCINVLIPIEQYREPLQVVSRRSEEMTFPEGGRSAVLPQVRRILPGVHGEESRELVRLLCSSRTTAEIADEIFCSERSAYRRIRSVYMACGVRNRSELRKLAARSGMALPPAAP